MWTLPASRSKGGRERAIPLSAQAVALLNRARGKSDGDRVFGPHVNVSVFIDAIRDRMQLKAQERGEEMKPWQPRDLRRTAATLCARLGADPFVVALVLGHARADATVPAVTQTYLRWNYEERVREALDRLGAWVEETVTRSSEPGDVVNMRARP